MRPQKCCVVPVIEANIHHVHHCATSTYTWRFVLSAQTIIGHDNWQVQYKRFIVSITELFQNVITTGRSV